VRDISRNCPRTSLKVLEIIMKFRIHENQIRDIPSLSLKTGPIRCRKRSVTKCEMAQRKIPEKWQHQNKSIFHITAKINYVYESSNKIKVALRKEYFSLPLVSFCTQKLQLIWTLFHMIKHHLLWDIIFYDFNKSFPVCVTSQGFKCDRKQYKVGIFRRSSRYCIQFLFVSNKILASENEYRQRATELDSYL